MAKGHVWIGVLATAVAFGYAIVACGYPPPDRVPVALDGDAGFLDEDIDAAPPDAPEIDAVPIDAPPDAPAGYVGQPPTSGGASFTGTMDVGKTMTASASGFGLGDPAAGYHYVWQRCTSSSCTSVTNIGTDASSYKLVSGDAGKYIRVGIYASNSCFSNCGTSQTVYSSSKGMVRMVTLSKGAECHPSGCSSSACRTYKVTLSGFSTASHTVTCNASNISDNPWFSYSTSTFPSERCCWGYVGKSTWVTVDGLKSNTLTW